MTKHSIKKKKKTREEKRNCVQLEFTLASSFSVGGEKLLLLLFYCYTSLVLSKLSPEVLLR